MGSHCNDVKWTHGAIGVITVITRYLLLSYHLLLCKQQYSKASTSTHNRHYFENIGIVQVARHWGRSSLKVSPFIRIDHHLHDSPIYF